MGEGRIPAGEWEPGLGLSYVDDRLNFAWCYGATVLIKFNSSAIWLYLPDRTGMPRGGFYMLSSGGRILFPGLLVGRT